MLERVLGPEEEQDPKEEIEFLKGNGASTFLVRREYLNSEGRTTVTLRRTHQ